MMPLFIVKSWNINRASSVRLWPTVVKIATRGKKNNTTVDYLSRLSELCAVR